MELLLYLSRITIFDSPVYSGASVLNSNTHVKFKDFPDKLPTTQC